MKREENKQQKFHNALLQMLYPPPPSPPPQEIEENKKLIDTLYLENEHESQEESRSSSEEDNQEGNVDSGKLTRAQRKRLRKKKLKETASQRRKIIGPLLPDEGSKVPETVRQNAAMGDDTRTDSSGEPASCSKQNKLKQRRKSKKLEGRRKVESVKTSIEVKDHHKLGTNDERAEDP